MMAKHEFNIEVMNGWFFVGDRTWSDLASIYWGEQQDAIHIALAPGIIAIGTPVRNEVVSVVIETREEQPPDTFDAWDHVVECNINVPSGSIMVGNIKHHDEESYITIAAGNYRACVYYGDTEGTAYYFESHTDDHYLIVLWPNEAQDVKVLKQGIYGQADESKYRDTQTVTQLIGKLRNGDVGERVHAAHSLGIIGDPQAFNPLNAALKDRNVCVRKAAVTAIGRFGIEGLPVLIELLKKDENKKLWPRTEEAVRDTKDYQAVKLLVAAMINSPNERLERAVWHTIYQMEGSAAIDKVLKPMLEDISGYDEQQRQWLQEMINRIEWEIIN